MIYVYLLAAFLAIPGLYIIFPWMIKLYIKHRTNKYLQEKQVSCLTFDDGPHPESTPKILNLLDGAGVKATFFILGKQAEAYPEVVKDIVERGHEIANHSYKHTHAWHTDPVTTLIDLNRGSNVIRKFMQNSQPVILRPPFGKLNLMSLIYVLFSGTKMVFWNLDSLDYKYDSSEKLRQELIPRLNAGQIILLHDGRSSDDDEVNDAMITVDSIASILKTIGTKKIRLMTVSQALYSTKK